MAGNNDRNSSNRGPTPAAPNTAQLMSPHFLIFSL
jgi:hypothetical protein